MTQTGLVSAPQGAYAARGYVADFFAAHFKDYLVDLRAAWGVDEKVLPDPVKIVRGPAGAIDKTPLLAVSAVYMPRMVRTDYDGDSIEWASTYMMRAFCWIIDKGLQDATDTRDLYSAAMRAALIDSPTLRKSPMTIDEGTLREDYSDPMKRNGDRFLLGSMVTFNAKINERQVRRPLGTVADMTIEPRLLPLPPLVRHPALD